MLNKRKVLMIHQVCDIRRPAGQQVVQAKDPVSLLDKPIAQVRPEKSTPPGDQRFCHYITTRLEG
jgi:hypothetical protein